MLLIFSCISECFCFKRRRDCER